MLVNLLPISKNVAINLHRALTLSSSFTARYSISPLFQRNFNLLPRRRESQKSCLDQHRAALRQTSMPSLSSLLANPLYQSQHIPTISGSIQQSDQLQTPSLSALKPPSVDQAHDPVEIFQLIFSLKKSPIKSLLNHSHPLRAISHFQSLISPLLTNPDLLKTTNKVQSNLLNKILTDYISILHDIIKNHPNRAPLTLSQTRKKRMNLRGNRATSHLPSNRNLASSNPDPTPSNRTSLWHPQILENSSNPLSLSPKVQNLLALTFIFDSWLKLSEISREMRLSNHKRIKPTSNAYNLVLKTISRFLNPYSNHLIGDEEQEIRSEYSQTLRLVAERIYWELRTEADSVEKLVRDRRGEGDPPKMDPENGEILEQIPQVDRLSETGERPTKMGSDVGPPVKKQLFGASNLNSLLIAFGTAGVPERGIEILQDWSDYYSFSQRSRKMIGEGEGNAELDGILLEGWSKDLSVWSSLIQSHVLAKDLEGASLWLERYRTLLSHPSIGNEDADLEKSSISTSLSPEKSPKPHLVFLSGCIRLLPTKDLLQAIDQGKEAMREDGIEFGAEVLSFLERVEWELGRGWKAGGMEQDQSQSLVSSEDSIEPDRSQSVNSEADSNKLEEIGKRKNQTEALKMLVSQQLGVDFFSRIFLRQLSRTESQVFRHRESTRYSMFPPAPDDSSQLQELGPDPTSSLSLLPSLDELKAPISNVKLSEMLSPFIDSPRSTLKLLLYFHQVVARQESKSKIFWTKRGGIPKNQSVSTHLMNLCLEALIYGNPRNPNKNAGPLGEVGERHVREMDLPAILILLQSFKALGLEPNQRTHRLALACCLKTQKYRIRMKPWRKIEKKQKKKENELNRNEDCKEEERSLENPQIQGATIEELENLKDQSDPNVGHKLQKALFPSPSPSGQTSHPDVLHFSAKPSVRGVRDLTYLLESIERGIELEMRTAYSFQQFNTLESKDLTKEILDDFEASDPRGPKGIDQWALKLVMSDEKGAGFPGQVEQERTSKNENRDEGGKRGGNGLGQRIGEIYQRKDGKELLSLVMTRAKDEILPRRDQLGKGGKGRIWMKKR